MKKFMLAMALAGLTVAFTSCSQGKSGGPGADAAQKSATQSVTSTVIQPKNTFSIDVPAMATSLKQGESKQFSIGIDRGTGMKQDVTLRFDGAPKGISFEPMAPVVRGTESEIKVMVAADAQAPVGDFTIKVTGHPETGVDATNEMKVSVSQQ